jgi:3-oxoacyl-[acyl-carrier protein] reductase
MDLGLAGRTAIVCGGSAGMGLAICESLRGEDANVVMFANEPGDVEREAERIGATPVAGDLREPADLERLVATAVERHGGVDVLVLNGGGPAGGLAEEVTADQLREAVELLLVPYVDLTVRCLPLLRASDGGRVVAVTSSSVREPIEQLALSNAVRPGLVGWLKTLAREVAADGVTVNAVAPGRIETRTFAEFYEGRSIEEDVAQIPARRWGSPAELGDVVCFLASRPASYVTGALVPVDGGLTHGLL